MVTRKERDSFGTIEVPADRLWGAQTQRSLEHFHISSECMPEEIIMALATVKRACALVNRDLGLLNNDKAKAIVQAADEVLAGLHRHEFPLSVWQTGSGTQSNMNMNEVLANRASELLGGVRGQENILKRQLVHVGAFNLSLILRKLLGAGTPRELRNLAGQLFSQLSRFLLGLRTAVSQVRLRSLAAGPQREPSWPRRTPRHRSRFFSSSATGC